MKVELKHITPDAEAYIGEAAAQCYDSSTEREACIRRAAHCMSVSHLATLRFASADFEISGISRVASHQLVRVAHAGILQRSQRYVKETRVEYIDPPALADIPPYLQHFWKTTQHDAEAIYLRAIEHGMKKEDAQLLQSNLILLLNLRDPFRMRCGMIFPAGKNSARSLKSWMEENMVLSLLRIKRDLLFGKHAAHTG